MAAAMEYTAVGRVQKTFGDNGELLSVFETDFVLDVKRPLFAEIDGLQVPFFIQKMVSKGTKKVVVFEHLASAKLAAMLAGKTLFIENGTAATAKEDGNTELRGQWIGYAVLDKGKRIGCIVQCFNFNGNLCFEIATEGGSKAFIPAHNDFIADADKKRRLLYMNLSEGMIES